MMGEKEPSKGSVPCGRLFVEEKETVSSKLSKMDAWLRCDSGLFNRPSWVQMIGTPTTFDVSKCDFSFPHFAITAQEIGGTLLFGASKADVVR